MKRGAVHALATVAVVFAASGCAPPVERWEGDWRAVRAEGPGMSDNEAVAAYVSALSLSFRGKYLRLATPDGEQAGIYRVMKEQADRVVLFTSRDGPGAPQTFQLEGDGTMVWHLRGGRRVVLERR